MLTPQQPTSEPAAADAEFDVMALAMLLWRWRWAGLALVLAGLAGAIIFLHFATYRYTAQLTVGPADQQGSSKVPGSLSSLGALAGVDLSGQSGTAFGLYSEAIASQPVAAGLATQPRIMRTIFKTSWDASSNQWRQPASPIRWLTQPVKQALGIPVLPWEAPDSRDLRDYIQTHVEITEDKKKNLIRLSFEHADPAFAAFFLSEINRVSDLTLRERSLSRVTTYIAYLEQRLQQVQIAEYRQSLSQALSNYENTRMMASSSASYASEPIGNVWVTRNPTSPSVLRVLGTGVAAGIVLWLLIIIAAGPIRQALTPPRS
jgi:uncharacterized protein involved in exopolysaccharide biosynthesis